MFKVVEGQELLNGFERPWTVLNGEFMHEPVLLNEVLELLEIKEGGTYIDGTVGSGGHALAMLERIGPSGLLLGIDCDEQALERARARLAGWEKQCFLVQANYADMVNVARSKNIDRVNGVLLDLGVSSEQLDAPERGFSFMKDGPLDMRMDGSAKRTAEELINNLPEEELFDILRNLGEEPMARRIARVVAREREKIPITTTKQLADLVARAVRGRRERVHPATRAFQALRMAVNSELDSLQKGLSEGLDMLIEGGRMAVVSFHSLEDRLVKRFFARHAGRWESLQAGGREWRGEKPAVSLVNRKPITPSDEEIHRNPRARSAKLRVAERKET